MKKMIALMMALMFVLALAAWHQGPRSCPHGRRREQLLFRLYLLSGDY